ncbi:hypothetical protein 2016_scaffold57_00103 [Bacteriophage sp.]|nr:hypothetical protein 2016_scaffold57_00103 [Bacteriophage sp.]
MLSSSNVLLSLSSSVDILINSLMSLADISSADKCPNASRAFFWSCIAIPIWRSTIALRSFTALV